jgi:hypothetical protein
MKELMTMAKTKPMLGHVQTPETASIASVIHFDPPAQIVAIRVGNRLVASIDIEAPGIEKLSTEPVAEFKTNYVVEKHTRLIVNLRTPAVMKVDWTEQP